MPLAIDTCNLLITLCYSYFMEYGRIGVEVWMGRWGRKCGYLGGLADNTTRLTLSLCSDVMQLHVVLLIFIVVVILSD